MKADDFSPRQCPGPTAGPWPGPHPRGFTLVEMIIVLAIMTVILLGAVSFLQSQIRAFTAGNERMARLQSYRFAANVLEKDLRVAGAGVPGNQPILIYADDDIVAFNSNFLSTTRDDPSAVYYDPDATTEETTALRAADAVTFPGTSFTYPAVDYVSAGVNSPAETIIFFFELDPEQGPGEEERYVLYRQVNGRTPEIVARNLYRNGDRPFFYYLRQRSGGGSGLDTIGSLPLRHDVPFHGSAADTALTGIPHIDQVRAIGINYQASAPGAAMGAARPGTAGLSTISRIVHLPDLGTVSARTCGASPLMGGLPEVHANPVQDSEGNITGYEVMVSWESSTDELGGEKDVTRYVVWRRGTGTLDWDEPIESIRATGEEDYYIVDGNVLPGETYQYGVAAQDCTPNLSPISVSTYITIPAIP